MSNLNERELNKRLSELTTELDDLYDKEDGKTNPSPDDRAQIDVIEDIVNTSKQLRKLR